MVLDVPSVRSFILIVCGFGILLGLPLVISVLAANAPARCFYEALGGVLVGQRSIEEYGEMLPGVVYGWSDIRALTTGAS